jgi:hypothetical protein
MRMNLWFAAGAWRAIIFWKQVGHSITEPPNDASHLICWPHTGHANLNSFTTIEFGIASPKRGNYQRYSCALDHDAESLAMLLTAALARCPPLEAEGQFWVGFIIL